MKKRLLIYPLLAFLVFTSAFTIEQHFKKEILATLKEPTNGLLFVDQKAINSQETGSVDFPFKTITGALTLFKSQQDFFAINIKDGVYTEFLILPENIALLGNGDEVIVQSPKPGSGSTITANNNVVLQKINVHGGRYGVYIPQDKTPVTIHDCSIYKASRWGVFNELHSDSSPSLKITNSRIINNTRQGAYLQRSTVSIEDSFFNENGEEGIDLHVNMYTKIKNSEIKNNGEGGIETELGGIDLEIDNCKITGNGSSGVNVQSFEANSNVQLSNNTIAENTNFGIRCALHAPFKSPYFIKMLHIADSNHFEKNGTGAIDKNCKRR